MENLHVLRQVIQIQEMLNFKDLRFLKPILEKLSPEGLPLLIN